MTSNNVEDEWMGGDEEDESLDKTLWLLETQGIIPGTPVTKEGGMNTTRPQDTTLEVGSMEIEWGDDEENEDFWLSQTLHVQEIRDTSVGGVTSMPRPPHTMERGMETLPVGVTSMPRPPHTMERGIESLGGVTSTPRPPHTKERGMETLPDRISEEDDLEDDWPGRQHEDDEEDEFWKNPLSFLSQGSPPGMREKESRLVTNWTSQEGVGGGLVQDQTTPHSITLEEEAVDNTPVLPTVSQDQVTGLSAMGDGGPFDGRMMMKPGGLEVVESSCCVLSPSDTQCLDGEMTDGERHIEESPIHTEPSISSLKKEGMYDDHNSPFTAIVTAQTPPTHTVMSKYHVRRPPSPVKEVCSKEEEDEDQGAPVMIVKPRDKDEDAPDARRKEVKPSSLIVDRKKCSYTKGGKCREHGAGAREKTISTSTNVIGPDGKLTVKRGKKTIFVCDINREKTSRSVQKTTASSKTRPSPEDNPPNIKNKGGKEEKRGDIIADKKILKQSTLSFMKTTPVMKTTSILKTTPVLEDNPHDIPNDTVEKGERFRDLNFYTLSEGTTTTHCEDRSMSHEECRR